MPNMHKSDRKTALIIVALSSVTAALLLAYLVPDFNDDQGRQQLAGRTEDAGREDLARHALELVNKDRAEHGLDPLLPSSNGAAQIHADDILKTGTPSHWLTTGEKPYLTYAKHGGMGGVRQNIAFLSYLDACVKTGASCEVIDPFAALEMGHHRIMSDDSDSPWGNREDVLNPSSTHVSFGIAYDRDSFVLVQNFEYNYVDLSAPIGQDTSRIKISGSVAEGRLYNISIYYDPFPTRQMYDEHKGESTYGFGRMLAIVEPPLPANSYYLDPVDHVLIVADAMYQDGTHMSASFDMSSIATEPGIYTVSVWLAMDGKHVPSTVYPVFVMPEASI